MKAAEDNSELFEEISEDFAARLRAGERPSVRAYADRYPDLAEEILDLFPGIEAMETIKGHRLSTDVRLPSSINPDIDRLGEFAIQREIGRGGMGIVYEAKQESLGRPVALKILPPSLFQNQDQVVRFKREAETSSRLQHDHIVPIYAVGQDSDIHYYAMQLIHGRGLDALFLDRSWLPKLAESLGLSKTKLVARIGLQVALALEHAHGRGVLHRDIKPSNLLVEDAGKVWVVDFGIAKVLDDQAMTRSGEFVGTLRYSPPEHFHGRFDGRSDLYSLGLTLHELLTGKPAFKGPGREALLRQVQDGELATPPKQVSELPRDLATIVSKATALDVEQRYQSAREMADDLSRFLEDLPVLARETPVFERVYRWARRNRAAAAGLAVAVLALIAASIIGWWAFLSTSASLQRERDANQLAESNLLFSLEAFDDLFDAIAGRDQALQMSDEGMSEVPVLPAVSEKDLDLLQRLLVFYDGFA
ncbi:MAG: serine/threonine protein kinase, partial [Planctomycetota bacterium]